MVTPSRARKQAAPRQARRTVLRGAISVALLIFLITQIELGDALDVLARARIDLLVLLALALLADRLLAAYRWYLLIRSAGSSPTFLQVLRLVFVSSFLGYLIPGGLGVDAFRIYGFARASSDVGLAVTSVVVDRALAILALIILVLVGLTLRPLGMPTAVGHLAWLGLGLLIAAIVTMMDVRLRRLTLLLLAPRWLAPLRRGLMEVYRQLDGYKRRPGLMLWSLIVALGFQLLRCLAPAIGAAALGSTLPLALYLAIIPVIVLLTLLPISIAGLGVQDVAFVYLLGLHGMPAETALLLSLLIHGFVFLSALPGAWLYMRRGLAPGDDREPREAAQ